MLGPNLETMELRTSLISGRTTVARSSLVVTPPCPSTAVGLLARRVLRTETPGAAFVLYTLHPQSNIHFDFASSVPAAAIADGLQTLLVVDRASGATLASITLIGDEVTGPDLRAEVDLLRAELDMLKRAFRRHCVETT